MIGVQITTPRKRPSRLLVLVVGSARLGIMPRRDGRPRLWPPAPARLETVIGLGCLLRLPGFVPDDHVPSILRQMLWVLRVCVVWKNKADDENSLLLPPLYRALSSLPPNPISLIWLLRSCYYSVSLDLLLRFLLLCYAVLFVGFDLLCDLSVDLLLRFQICCSGNSLLQILSGLWNLFYLVVTSYEQLGLTESVIWVIKRESEAYDCTSLSLSKCRSVGLYMCW